jgi:sulfite reductase (NADPH) hemoprotein beta-component
MSANELIRSTDITQPVESLHRNEQLKAKSLYLRGTINQGLNSVITGAVCDDDTQLLKFHGIYQQDDRDKRGARARRKLEPNYQFMVRLRIPAGRLSAAQWLALDSVAARFAERGLRVTTRQTVQLHGVRKPQLQAAMQAIRAAGLDTVAACGDDSRGVVCGYSTRWSEVDQQVAKLAKITSDRLIPATKAYREIWYNEEPAAPHHEEPVYGALYLPRKFKVGYVIPPDNDVDIYGQDLGFIAVVKDKKLQGFNVCIGGGMGQLDSRQDSYPRLAETVGFIAPSQAPALAQTIMEIQRDFGDRKDRHRARFKYTLDRLGVEWFHNELARRWGGPLQAAHDIAFERNADRTGWQQGSDDLWRVTLTLNSGRIEGPVGAQIAAFLQNFTGRIRLTTNQNLQLTHIGDYEKRQIQWRLDDLGLAELARPELQKAHTISCVSLPTCGLAMAEAERITPSFLHKFNAIKTTHQLQETPITLRISGCPNGCARPYIAEIALTGRAPGLYNLYLGGSHHGDRLAQLYAGNLSETQILTTLDGLLSRYALQRKAQESFGDFFVRQNSNN